MSSTILSLTLALATGSTGGLFSDHLPQGGHILPPMPGYGLGFPNGNPDGYGWFDYGIWLPLGADRTADWYFQRYWSIPVEQMVFPTYYNPYVTRGQRYVPFTGCGALFHPAGGPPLSPAATPIHPYNDTLGTGPLVQVPKFTGRVEAGALPASGSSGLTP